MTSATSEPDVAADRPVVDDVAEESPSTGTGTGRRRRPTGEAPPLPAGQQWRGVRWAIVGLAAVVASLIAFLYFESTALVALDESVSRWFAGRRSVGAVAIAEGLDLLTHPTFMRIVRWGTIAVLLAFRRVRHLAVFVAALFVVEWAAQGMNFAIQRPRPPVVIVGDWKGFSHPSLPIAAMTVTLMGSLRALAPHGPIRRGGAIGVGVLVALVGAARMLLGVDHLTDVVVAAGLGAGTALAMTRLLVPHQRHPVTYRRGEHAHVELEQERIDAIRTAVRDQLGVEVGEVELFGADGSAGSTPLRLEVAGGSGPAEFFAKLYTQQHRRSDRIYKFGRLLLHGRLENESGFATVRRLVEYEDHMTRFLEDAGVHVPRSWGPVEITPEREYLLVFDLLPGEDFKPDVQVSDALIDDCLHLVAQLWTAGVAHRDIKPGNILVDGDRAALIDVAFAQIRPTPWRQAVDLGAMLLLLALAAGPERVHARAMEVFSEEEIAEALAATDGFAIPSQLRDMLEADGWEVRDRLREMVVDREPIRIQRWDRRRLLALAATIAGAIIVTGVTLATFDTVGLL